MQSYPNFSTPTPGTMRGPDESPDNLIKDRVKIAEAKAAVRTLITHVNGLDEFAVNMYQNADSAIYDVRGEIAKMRHGISKQTLARGGPLEEMLQEIMTDAIGLHRNGARVVARQTNESMSLSFR